MQTNDDFIKYIEKNKALTEARDAARKAVWEVSPDATELDEPTPDMYEFDAIDVLDPESEYSHVSIMQDSVTEDFALVEHLRVTPEIVREAEHSLQQADMLQKMDLRVMMLMQSHAMSESCQMRPCMRDGVSSRAR
jgi:hypothetical protein